MAFTTAVTVPGCPALYLPAADMYALNDAPFVSLPFTSGAEAIALAVGAADAVGAPEGALVFATLGSAEADGVAEAEASSGRGSLVAVAAAVTLGAALASLELVALAGAVDLTGSAVGAGGSPQASRRTAQRAKVEGLFSIPRNGSARGRVPLAHEAKVLYLPEPTVEGNMSEPQTSRPTVEQFVHGGSFEQGEISGNVRLGKFEAHYEELFAEALEDGVITNDERVRLERAADSFGLDRERVLALEKALTAAWEGRHRIAVREVVVHAEETPATSLRPLEIENDPQVKALRRRIGELEAKVLRLEGELEEARSHIAVEVDFSDLVGAAPAPGDPEELYRRIRHDARDVASLHALFQTAKESDLDRAFRTAHVLAFLGEANDEETEVDKRYNTNDLVRPTASLAADAWRRNLFHPDEEVLTGDIFAVVTSPVLLGRVTALRHQNALPKLDPARLQDPKTSTVQAVRCFAWAASIMGMNPPPLYADPSWDGTIEMVPGIPPASRLGKRALSGRSAEELAFMAGKHLASYREDHFVRLLFPSIPDLEDIFLAALTIGQPQLPLAAQVKQRAVPIARAIEPLLDAAQKDRLRGHFLRFVEEGGRTNLQRWAYAAELTTLRAGLLLANDLGAAKRVLELGGDSDLDAKVDDLIVFFTGDRCSRLRKQIGISL